ncbi:MAG TPA: hypothetical protein VKV95_19415 [Terriglobia bacterium]|nr:hypothetical protein [Terriglobia bacterium]
MATVISNLDIGLVVGFFCGVGSFFKGFRTYREYLLLQGTPRTPIRSMAMGFVRIHGKARNDQLVQSPISQTPCCYYTVEIEKWETREDSGTWLHYGAEAEGVWFYIEDSTGRVLVNPHGAEYELEITGMREVGSTTASSFAVEGVSDRDLLAYVARVGMTAKIPGLHHPLGTVGARLALSKYMKHQTTPDELFKGLVGPQVAQLQHMYEAQGPQSDPLGEEIRLAMIELYNHPFWSPEYEELRKRIVNMQERHKKLRRSGSIPPPQPIPPNRDVAAPAPNPPEANPPVPDPLLAAEQPLASGRYRLTECCILPDHDYDITGTCAENPGARDLNDRNLIRKGTNELTYLISGLSRSDVNTMMSVRAQLMIFGGGILATVCLTLLFLRFGLL